MLIARHWLMLAIVALATTACQSSKQAAIDAGAKQLTVDQFRNQIVGFTFTATLPGGTPAEVYYADDGTTAARSVNFLDEGKWTAGAENSICFTWKRVRGGQTECITFYRQGQSYVAFDPGGTETGRFTTKKPGKTF